MDSIVLNGVNYNLDEIISGSARASTDFDRSTIAFCQSWLTGKSEFKIQTSGSTGNPKEIVLSRAQMIASAEMTATALNLKSNYTALLCLDTNYIAGQMMLVRSFVVGMQIIAIEPSANPLAKLGNQKIDFAAFVPYQVQAIINENSLKLDQVRTAIVGGAPIDSWLKNQLANTNCQLYATYGMTETISHIAIMSINGINVSDHYSTLPDISISQDERKCLVISAPFLKNNITTNDIVELRGENEFKWIGRWDNVINTGGVKVIPEKLERSVEEIFNQSQLSNRFFIAGMPDKSLGQRVSLFIEGNQIDPAIEQKLILAMKKTFTKYEVPKEIKYLEKFEETNTGKIDRKKTVYLCPT